MVVHKKAVTNPVAGDVQHAEGIDWNEIHINTFVTKTGNATLTATEEVILADATAGAFTLTLPTAVGISGRCYMIKKIDTALANLVTIATTSSQTIDGVLNWILSQRGDFLLVQSDNANWRVLDYSPFDISTYKAKGSTLNLWYGAPCISLATSTFTGVNGTMKAIPMILTKPTTLDQIQAEVTTLLANGKFRIGIYTDNGNMYPKDLVAGSDVVELTTDAAGVKTATFGTPIVLQPGLYWLAWLANTAGTAIWRAHGTTAIIPLLGYISTMGAVSQGSHWSVAQAYAALPSAFPAGGTVQTAVAVPIVLVRSTG